MKARDERKDTVALVLGATIVGAFLVGSLVAWPAAAITLVIGVCALAFSLRG